MRCARWTPVIRLELEAQTRRELEAHRSWWHVADASRVLSAATPSELKRLVEQTPPGRLVVVDYFSPSCNGCRALFPKVKALAAARADLDVVQVNVSTPEWQAFCVNMGIATIPWFHLFRDGGLLEGFPASLASLHKLHAQIDLHSAPPAPAALVA
ncbi:hypothetical protein H632_c65p0 [Helicosporidium sp. ATCC 50920]|nr:hypothetical protein H632_c65p0 [Helicosporidium sp. ATCC 50920]|eukprot:KDD76923.1 hypothetical protein H632_c65p0 [Helicosporidium sp. ATCC 50920]